MAISAAFTAFSEKQVTADVLDEGDFADFAARRLRYQILWAFYESTAYRDIHKWAKGYRARYGLYKYVRSIYNPAYRLGEFWRMMLWGGLLDPGAGNSGALPVIVGEGADEIRLRSAVSLLWRYSNWQVNKDICTLWGATLGDVGLAIVDDPEHRRVRMEVIHPGTIKSVTVDAMGHVKEYELEYDREDPERPGQQATYLETAERSGQNVVYRTYRNGNAYAWNGEAAEWSVGYGFTPFVILQHNNVGLSWGWSEQHALRSKIHEADDLASKISDYIRKYADPVWLFNFAKPRTDPEAKPTQDEIPAVYAPTPEARGQALVTENLDLEQSLAAIEKILAEMEHDYPELRLDLWTATGDASGRALRIARQPVEQKVRTRRGAYDGELVRAQQMAIAIAGWRGYPGFEGYDLTSYDRGELDHEIDGERPVFQADPADDAEAETAFWTAASAAVNAGATLEGYLRSNGWDDERIQTLLYSGVPEQ
ncbi:MAG TPA: hypothetical protein PKD55_09660 [Bellilinea sp.]|nr:hypothetical protein [Bellilinea sp.]